MADSPVLGTLRPLTRSEGRRTCSARPRPLLPGCHLQRRRSTLGLADFISSRRYRWSRVPPGSSTATATPMWLASPDSPTVRWSGCHRAERRLRPRRQPPATYIITGGRLYWAVGPAGEDYYGQNPVMDHQGNVATGVQPGNLLPLCVQLPSSAPEKSYADKALAASPVGGPGGQVIPYCPAGFMVPSHKLQVSDIGDFVDGRSGRHAARSTRRWRSSSTSTGSSATRPNASRCTTSAARSGSHDRAGVSFGSAVPGAGPRLVRAARPRVGRPRGGHLGAGAPFRAPLAARGDARRPDRGAGLGRGSTSAVRLPGGLPRDHRDRPLLVAAAPAGGGRTDRRWRVHPALDPTLVARSRDRRIIRLRHALVGGRHLPRRRAVDGADAGGWRSTAREPLRLRRPAAAHEEAAARQSPRPWGSGGVPRKRPDRRSGRAGGGQAGDRPPRGSRSPSTRDGC